jgi:hypothetical protein
MVVTLPRNLSTLSLTLSDGLGKGWETCGNPYHRTQGMEDHPIFRVGIVVHLCKVYLKY